MGPKIKMLRQQKNINQEELGKIVGAGKTTISNYETGYSVPDFETLVKLADYFNVSTDYMLGRTDIPNFQKLPQQKTQQLTNNSFLTSSEKKIIKLFQQLKTEKFKEKAIKQFESYVDTLAEIELEFEELEESGPVKPDSVPSTQ
ncbi:helix-turn-helix transcriptional regulator [Acetobacterium wieringae]|uniref:Helix-turn-helix transcriptional regulator n=1 Tax=Acetobacterium wieringae TaxID=52694 RepID=A0ABY6HLC3_9FIRM|nr:helix-turn-helix transcriptional regulator [Acetobacterium wieringae]UYO64378.1 helix-turn-helix transcriptional regulator [Acetobacterium wieringae]VUZ26990.1 Uncharacterised protein [Acetobacterium wieringae]